MKIRIIKDIGPFAKVGEQCKVWENSEGLYMVTGTDSYRFYLKDLEGYYEEAEELPENGTGFCYINLGYFKEQHAGIIYANFDRDRESYKYLFNIGNFFLKSEKEEAQKICDSFNETLKNRKRAIK